MSWTDYGIETTSINDTSEYRAISQYYDGKCANRSKMPYMNHIDEGLVILQNIGASNEAQRAFCLHPIYQMDGDLIKNQNQHNWVSSNIMLLTMEYRYKANSYLCKKETDHYTKHDLPTLPLLDVKHMLIADKVQNYKDFIKFHKNSHPRSTQLDNYFQTWLLYLGVFDKEYTMLTLHL